MKFLVFGHSGRIERELMLQALAEGHEVVHISSSRKYSWIGHKNYRVLHHAYDNLDDISPIFNETDAIVGYVGKLAFRPSYVCTNFVKEALVHMKENNINRIVLVTSSLSDKVGLKNASWFIKYVVAPISFFSTIDLRRAENLLTNSGVNYTIVRPAQLTNDKMKRKYSISQHSFNKATIMSVSAADVAHFVLNCVLQNCFLKKTISISETKTFEIK